MSWAYITCIGETPEAVYGPLWALIERGVKPSTFCLLYTKGTKRLVDLVKEHINMLIGIDDIFVETKEISEVDVEEISKTIEDLVSSYKNRGFKVIVDVTPGRKPMSIAAYQGAIRGKADLTTYLHLMSRDFEKTPYPLIPRSLIRLVELQGSIQRRRGLSLPQQVAHEDFMEITLNEIYPFINLMCEYANHDSITIELPYLDIKLLTLKLEYPQPKIEHIADLNYFKSKLRSKGIQLGHATLPFNRDEKDIFSLFRDSLIAAGALKLDYQGLLDEIRREVNGEGGVLRPGLAVIALDTNMLYMRFVTGYLLRSVDINKLRILIATRVIQEIMRRFLTKRDVKEETWIKEHDKILELASRAGVTIPSLPDRAEPLSSRLTRLAAIELEELKSKIEKIEPPISIERGDLAIIESYKLKEKNSIFITGDEKAAHVAAMQGLKAFLVKQDLEIDKENVELTYKNLPRLILSLATLLTMIVIRIPKTQIETIVLGAWKDMTKSWKKPTIQVKASHPIHNEAKRTIEKTREMLSTPS